MASDDRCYMCGLEKDKHVLRGGGLICPVPEDAAQLERESSRLPGNINLMSKQEFEAILNTRNAYSIGVISPIPGYTLFENDTYRVQIRDGLLSFIDLWYQMSARDGKEALCALVGGYDVNCSNAFVHEAICFEFGEPASVTRNASELTQTLKGLWDASEHQIFFLGEWHSHPGQPNRWSELDVETATATCRESRLNEIFMLISGADGLAVSVVTPSGKVHELDEVY